MARRRGGEAEAAEFPAVRGWVNPLSMSEQASEFGVIGLTPAGRAIALRLAARGGRVSLWDDSFNVVEQFVLDHKDTRGGLVGYADLEDFFGSLAPSAAVVLFVRADGEAARAAQLAGPGRRLIDGGNGGADPDDATLGAIEARLFDTPG